MFHMFNFVSFLTDVMWDIIRITLHHESFNNDRTEIIYFMSHNILAIYTHRKIYDHFLKAHNFSKAMMSIRAFGLIIYF